MLDLIDWQNKKYTTRNGQPVRILCVDKEISAVIGVISSERFPTIWGINGRYFSSSLNDNDLINAKTKREGWINIYAGGRIGRSRPFKSEEEAISQGTNPLATIKIEWEE